VNSGRPKPTCPPASQACQLCGNDRPLRGGRAALLGALIAVGGVGCRKHEPASPVLVRVGEWTLTEADLQRQLNQMPPLARASFGTKEQQRQLVEGLARDQLLSREAANRNLESAPAVREQLQRAMIQELLRIELDTNPADPSREVEVQRYYDSHLQEYVRPDRVRASHLLIVASAVGKRAARIEAEHLCGELEQQVRRGESGAFEAAVLLRSSDPATRRTGGALGLLTREELALALDSREAADRAFSLEPGRIGAPIETPRGFELVRIDLKAPGLNQSLDAVRGSIRSLVDRERQGQRFEALVRSLRERDDVSFDEQALARLHLHVSAARATSLGGPIGEAPARGGGR
jgi:peptidyl-prolyl cis-trans isomerase C